jgi:transcription elongation factor GreA
MSPSFLTREGYQKLQDELDHLRNIKRMEIADRLHEAMDDGELIDNAEYEAAKNEQAFVEGRIKELEILLANARVIDESHISTEVVQIGSTITIKEEGFEPEIYTIVGTAEADPRYGRISNESPLGKAVLNHKSGDQISIEAPEGAYKVQIVKVE